MEWIFRNSKNIQMAMPPVILPVNLEQVHLVYLEERNRIIIPEPEIVLMSNNDK